MKTAGFILRIIFSCFIIVLGIVLLCLGASHQTGFDYPDGDIVYDNEYVGDFYTDIQRAVADASNNIYDVGVNFYLVFGSLFIVGGFLTIFVGGYLLACTFFACELKKQQKSDILIDTLNKYKVLLDSGVLTQEEFEEKKKNLLNS